MSSYNVSKQNDQQQERMQRIEQMPQCCFMAWPQMLPDSQAPGANWWHWQYVTWSPVPSTPASCRSRRVSHAGPRRVLPAACPSLVSSTRQRQPVKPVTGTNLFDLICKWWSTIPLDIQQGHKESIGENSITETGSGFHSECNYLPSAEWTEAVHMNSSTPLLNKQQNSDSRTLASRPGMRVQRSIIGTMRAVYTRLHHNLKKSVILTKLIWVPTLIECLDIDIQSTCGSTSWMLNTKLSTMIVSIIYTGINIFNTLYIVRNLGVGLLQSISTFGAVLKEKLFLNLDSFLLFAL